MTNKGESNGRHKDGRQIPGKGHRLGWVSNELWQAMEAQAKAKGFDTISDFVIAAIVEALENNS